MNSVISCSVLVAGIVGNALGDRRILEPPPVSLLAASRLVLGQGHLQTTEGNVVHYGYVEKMTESQNIEMERIVA